MLMQLIWGSCLEDHWYRRKGLRPGLITLIMQSRDSDGEGLSAFLQNNVPCVLGKQGKPETCDMSDWHQISSGFLLLSLPFLSSKLSMHF